MKTKALDILMIAAVSVAASPAGAEPLNKHEQAPQKTVHSQKAWVVQNCSVELAVTQLGGHMAPVTFYRDTAQPIAPYYISPWQDERLELEVPVLVPLRGDFFCMPFGGNGAEYEGEKHPPHGETAGSKWSHKSFGRQGKVTRLVLELETRARKGQVLKELSLVDGLNVVYTQHTIKGFIGKTPLGHHATLAMPENDGEFRIATSPIQFGLTNPTQFSNPENGEYQSFQINHRFDSLTKVALVHKGTPDADVTKLPARRGYADLLMLVSQPADQLDGPAWTTATNQKQGFLWFSLKDPTVLPATVFWLENHGRHGVPWKGRNNCLGLEEVCAYFADGLVPSVSKNPLSELGVKTAVTLSPGQATQVRTIQGVVKIPTNFEMVKTLEFSAGQLTFVSTTGKKVTVPVHHEFIRSGMIR